MDDITDVVVRMFFFGKPMPLWIAIDRIRAIEIKTSFFDHELLLNIYLRVCNLYERKPEGIYLRELSQYLGFSRQEIHRGLNELVFRVFIEHDAESVYRLFRRDLSMRYYQFIDPERTLISYFGNARTCK